MQLQPKVLILFFIKNFLSTIYVVPIWFVAVIIFQYIWAEDIAFLPLDAVALILQGAGLIFFALLIFLCYYWAVLSFTNYRYDLQSDGLHIQKGVIIKKHLIIPFDQVTTIELYINPLVVRTLNLYSLMIKTRQRENTAGIFNKAHAEIISGLSLESAQQLRNELIKLSHIQSTEHKFFDPTSGKYR